MAIAFRIASTDAATATSVNPAKPTGLADNDVLVAVSNVDANETITAPSGWTACFTQVQTGTQTVNAWYRVVPTAASEPATYAFGGTGAVARRTTILAYSGVDTTTPLDVTGSITANATSTVVHAVSITTVTNGAVAVWAGAYDSSTFSVTKPAATTLRDEAATLYRLTLADLAMPTAGATGDQDGSAGTARANVGILIALRPAGAGGGGAVLDATITAVASLTAAAFTPVNAAISAVASLSAAFAAAVKPPFKVNAIGGGSRLNGSDGARLNGAGTAVGGAATLAATIQATAIFTAKAFTPVNAPAIAAVATLTAAAPTPLNAPAIAAVASITAKAPTPLNATISAVASMTATAPTPLNATVAAAASLSAQTFTPVNATISATATATAKSFTPLNATIAAQASMTAVVFTPVNATMAATASMTANLSTGPAGLAATIVAVATFTATAPTPLNAPAIPAAATLTAAAFTPLNAAPLAAAATFSAKAFTPLNATVAAAATFSASLAGGAAQLNATIAAAATLTASAPTPLNAPTMAATAAMTVKAFGPLNAVIIAAATASAKAPTPLNAQIAAFASLSGEFVPIIAPPLIVLTVRTRPVLVAEGPDVLTAPGRVAVLTGDH